MGPFDETRRGLDPSGIPDYHFFTVKTVVIVSVWVSVWVRVWVFVLLTAGCALHSPQRSDTSVSPITEVSVRSHMAFLASDALNGRGSGTRDEWIAAAYLGSQMQQWGLEPLGDSGGFVQQIEIERLETTAPPTLSVNGKKYTHGRDIRVQVLSAARVSGLLQKYSPGSPVKPGAVLLMPATPATPAPGASTAPTSGASVGPLATGAAVVLTLEAPDAPKPASGGRFPAPPPRFVGVDSPAASRPTAVALGTEAYAAVSALKDGAIVVVEAEVKPGSKTQTWNAVGRLTGRVPKTAAEVILLSAHLDHLGARAAANAAAGADTIYNGADDDASGSVAVLELARAIALGPRPDRTIVFAFFGSEESGGLGSRFFADRPVVPISQIVANLQFEMIGRPDAKVPPHTLWLTGYERSTLGPALAKEGARLVQDPHPEQSFFTRSDNIQFARRGVIAHTVSSYGLHKEYHQPSDEIRSIDFAHMTDSIRSMLKPILWLANSGFTPEWRPGMKP
jgi:aminopeptidase YwaD